MLELQLTRVLVPVAQVQCGPWPVPVLVPLPVLVSVPVPVPVLVASVLLLAQMLLPMAATAGQWCSANQRR
jgi:hypothetical protein